MAKGLTQVGLTSIVVNLLVSTFAVVVTAYILPGVHISGLLAALITAIVLGVINALLKPFLLFLTLPLNILSLGLFTLVVNAFLVLLTAAVVPGFTIDNFWWALVFSLILSLVNSFLHQLT